MSTFTKPLVVAITALALTSTVAAAAPRHYGHNHGNDRGNVTRYERVQITQARANLAGIKSRAWSDGKLSFFERARINFAEARLQSLINRARRS